jgi:hypothetical protein
VDVRTYPPINAQIDSTWQAPANGSATVPASPATSEPPRDMIRLYPPAGNTPPAPAAPTPADTKAQAPVPAKPGASDQALRPSSLPVGIPQFATVRDQVSSGLKPLVDGGLEWLEANHYRTVLHIRSPGQDDSADRRQVEKHGMKYQTLEVSPQTLSQPIIEQFNRIVNDPLNAPLFVYDKDGTLGGALWYLHFRIVEQA